MQGFDIFLICLGSMLGLGLLTSTIGERTSLPRATLLILLGIALGKFGMNVLPSVFTDYFDTITQITLMMVGFLIGGKLKLSELARSASAVFAISLMAALVTALIVGVGLAALGVEAHVALTLGVIAAATAPAAVVDVIEESASSTRFCNLLLSVVALDDVWALLMFALVLATLAQVDSTAQLAILTHALYDIFVALALGTLIGLPAAYLTGRIKAGQPMMLEAVSCVCICGGLAMWFNVSYLIACMAMGAVIVNLAKHHDLPFHEIGNIERLFLIVFFLVAGASLEIGSVSELGLVGAAFITFRATGKYLGAWLGAKVSNTDKVIARGMRIALLPQAGVSIGMALVAANHFPTYGDTLLTIVIGSTVFFELVGPALTRQAIRAADKNEREAE